MKKEYMYLAGGVATTLIAQRIMNPPITKMEATSFVENWLDIVCKHDPKAIASLYASDGVLVGTIAEEILITRNKIKTYFDMFVTKQPCGVYNTKNVIILHDVAIVNGTYTFDLLNDEGVSEPVKARYTFVLKRVDGKLRIATHHSSAQPTP
tara:strand:- start:1151 stop:1606 length:456 start_codon:yes stop_codon:yes gene_type:complete